MNTLKMPHSGTARNIQICTKSKCTKNDRTLCQFKWQKYKITNFDILGGMGQFSINSSN